MYDRLIPIHNRYNLLVPYMIFIHASTGMRRSHILKFAYIMTFDEHLTFCNNLMNNPVWQTGGKPAQSHFMSLNQYEAAFIPGVIPNVMRQCNVKTLTSGHIVTQDDLFRTWGMLGNPYSNISNALKSCKNGSRIEEYKFRNLLSDATARFKINFYVRTPTYLEFAGITIAFNFAPCGESSLTNVTFKSFNYKRVGNYLEWVLEPDSVASNLYIPTMTAPIITVTVKSPLDSRPNIDNYSIRYFTGYNLHYDSVTDTIDKYVSLGNYGTSANTVTRQDGQYKIRQGTFTMVNMDLGNTGGSAPEWTSKYDYHPDYLKPQYDDTPLHNLLNDFAYKKVWFQYRYGNVFLIAPSGDNNSYGTINIGPG